MPGSNKISLQVEALTPIWTGDIKGETNYLRATSFIGGLRFWTEALLRAYGHNVCTDDAHCKPGNNGDSVCAACGIFGCTGLARSFEMHVKYPANALRSCLPVETPVLRPAACINPSRNNNSWYFTNGLKGKFTLSISPSARSGIISTGEVAPWNVARLGLFLMLKYGALGAKDQYGYGIVRVHGNDLKPEVNGGSLRPGHHAPAKGFPSLQDFFFFHGNAPDSSHETPLVVRCNTRKALRDGPAKVDSATRHQFCGYLQRDDRQATKFTLARIGSGKDATLLGWGWYPRGREEREKCVNALHGELSSSCKCLAWREFNSTRDTQRPAAIDWAVYVKCLEDEGWWQTASQLNASGGGHAQL